MHSVDTQQAGTPQTHSVGTRQALGGIGGALAVFYSEIAEHDLTTQTWTSPHPNHIPNTGHVLQLFTLRTNGV